MLMGFIMVARVVLACCGHMMICRLVMLCRAMCACFAIGNYP
jgi:hypothetical protein